MKKNPRRKKRREGLFKPARKKGNRNQNSKHKMKCNTHKTLGVKCDNE